jgi:hypothetical protein
MLFLERPELALDELVDSREQGGEVRLGGRNQPNLPVQLRPS